MGRRKELKGITEDVTASLGTRNNDYLGYWATGQLCKLAKEDGTNRILIDVLKKEMRPYDPYFSEIYDTYYNVFNKQLKARRLQPEWIKKIQLEYLFEQERDKSLHRWIGIGKPYTLKITVESDNGRKYEKVTGGYCRPHDPAKETRRLGF